MQGTQFQPCSRKSPHAAEGLNPRITTAELWCPGARALQEEEPPHGETRAPHSGGAPAAAARKRLTRSNEDPVQPKISK